MIFELVHIIVIWILVFLLHEVMHCFDAWCQGSDEACIIINLRKLSMYASFNWELEYDEDDLYLSGGLYTSLVCFLLVFVSGGWMGYYFFMLGWLQFCYGFFEWKYHSRSWFRLGRYALYMLVVTVLGIIWMVK
jgi:hypothetical protein